MAENNVPSNTNDKDKEKPAYSVLTFEDGPKEIVDEENDSGIMKSWATVYRDMKSNNPPRITYDPVKIKEGQKWTVTTLAFEEGLWEEVPNYPDNYVMKSTVKPIKTLNKNQTNTKEDFKESLINHEMMDDYVEEKDTPSVPFNLRRQQFISPIIRCSGPHMGKNEVMMSQDVWKSDGSNVQNPPRLTVADLDRIESILFLPDDKGRFVGATQDHLDTMVSTKKLNPPSVIHQINEILAKDEAKLPSENHIPLSDKMYLQQLIQLFQSYSIEEQEDEEVDDYMISTLYETPSNLDDSPSNLDDELPDINEVD